MRIAFYPAQSGKPFTGDTLAREALGGSETAVIYVAKGLASLGHEVIVFTRGTPGIYDDVVYSPFARAHAVLRTLPLDVLVCVRDPLPLTWPHQAKITALWHHDLPAMKPPDATYQLFVSVWQANLFVQMGAVQKERARVLYNGVDTALFPSPATPKEFTADDPIQLVWTSNPERGLWMAGEVLQRIRRMFPQATLHVFGRNAVYGWDSSYEGNFLPTDMTNVVLHDAATKAQLADELRKADLFVYPTWWPETYCIAAMEAQAAGVPIVATKLAALEEVPAGAVLVGDEQNQPTRANPVADPHYLDRFALEAINLLQHVEKRRQMQQEGLAKAKTMDWSIHVANWHRLFTETLAHA